MSKVVVFTLAAITAGLADAKVDEKIQVKENAERGSFQIVFTSLGEQTDERTCQRLLEISNALKAQGYHTTVQLSYQGRDKQRVAWPCVWVNKEARKAETSSATEQALRGNLVATTALLERITSMAKGSTPEEQALIDEAKAHAQQSLSELTSGDGPVVEGNGHGEAPADNQGGGERRVGPDGEEIPF